MAGRSTQVQYLQDYMSGMTMEEIGAKYGRDKSTVSRGVSRAMVRYRCPFSACCERCPLPECAIKDEYAMLVNSFEDKRTIRRNRRKMRQ